MGTNECSQPASKSSWDSQDFGDISMVLKMAHFRKSTGPRWVNFDAFACDSFVIWFTSWCVKQQINLVFVHFIVESVVCN